jgi:hypothetical protein
VRHLHEIIIAKVATEAIHERGKTSRLGQLDMQASLPGPRNPRHISPDPAEVPCVEVEGSSQAASHVKAARAEVARSWDEACELVAPRKILCQDAGPVSNDHSCQAAAAAQETGAQMTKASSPGHRKRICARSHQ